jgi:threonine/homoserine/homoserine lactone efflux protein
MDTPTLQTSATFFGIALVLAVTPGPDNLFVLMESATHGRKTGMSVVMGLCTGLVVHTVLVTLGLAAVFAASPAAFNVLKFVGSGYLVYLAWQALRAPAASPLAHERVKPTLMRSYVKGIVLNLTNPKVVIFFLAFLPQFVQPGSGPVALQILYLGLVFIVAILLAFSLINYFATLVGERLLGSARGQRVLNSCAGLVFVGLALRLALSDR